MTQTTLLGDITNTTIQRNASRSSAWLFNKIKKSTAVTKVRKPHIGKMYVFVYDPKTKDKLPYYDINPLVIPFEFYKGGFIGLNFHYLSVKDRKLLLSAIDVFQKVESEKEFTKLRMQYSRLLKLSNGQWKHTVKKYLYKHLRTPLVEIPTTDWINILELPLAHFVGATKRQVYKDARKLR